MKCLFIYNPTSGKSKKIIDNLDCIKQTLTKKYHFVDIVETQYPKHATKLASDACGIYDILVFSGGDGTFNEVIQGLAQKTIKPILSYIPAGTACDMAKNLNIPNNLKKALEISVGNNIKSGDICKINENYFVYVAAIGVYTSVPYLPTPLIKKRLGKLAYFIEGVKHSFNIKNIKVKMEVNGKTYNEETILLLVANSKSVGGFAFNKKANLRDGKVDIILIKQNILTMPFNVWKLFLFGVNYMKKKKSMILINTNKVKIEVGDDVSWDIDGEKGVFGSVEIEVLREHISFLVPKKRGINLNNCKCTTKYI